MAYVIDPRKNWAMAEQFLAHEEDRGRQRILETLIAHSKAEAAADFEALMATVSPRAHYHSYVSGDGTINEAQSPQGKKAIASYYKNIVESGCHLIEHDVTRMAVGQDVLTTEGELSMAYPGPVLNAMGIEIPDREALYLYQQRLLIVWGFDEDGLVLCEDSYGGGGDGFENIAERPLAPEEIYRIS